MSEEIAEVHEPLDPLAVRIEREFYWSTPCDYCTRYERCPIIFIIEETKEKIKKLENSPLKLFESKLQRQHKLWKLKRKLKEQKEKQERCRKKRLKLFSMGYQTFKRTLSDPIYA